MTCQEKAALAYAGKVPAWVQVLAEACDRQSVRKIAIELGISAATVSLGINKKLKNTAFLEKSVFVKLQASILSCPVLGLIATDTCKEIQKQPYSPHNPMKVSLYRACNKPCMYNVNFVKDKNHVCTKD